MKIRLLVFLLLLSAVLFAAEPFRDSSILQSVSVTGYVEVPGVYQVLPTSRLSDAIALANKAALAELAVAGQTNQQEHVTALDPKIGNVSSAPQHTSAFARNQALRSVQLIRNGQSTSYDLAKFLRLGDISQNPYLKDGDVIVLSPIEHKINISGAVNIPGDVEIKSGERLEHIIALSKGISYDADLSAVQIYRYADNKIDFNIITLNLETDARQYGFELQAGDNIIIPQVYEIANRSKVNVIGQVKNPGVYVIGKAHKLSDVLQQAGGLSPIADIANIIVYNSYINGKLDPFLESLMKRSMSDMTPIEYSYLRTNLQQLKGKYNLNMRKFAASEGKEENLVLRDGDSVFVPELMQMVWVSGQVRHPGLVPWKEGAKWDYYIEVAGGYTNNRKYGKGRLIRGDSGNWVKPNKNVPILPGDTVFIPSQSDRSLWLDVKDGITLLSSVITIIVGLRALGTN